MRHGSHLARSHGAQYTYINGGGSWYSTTLGYAMGGHPWSVRISPFGNCERFMIQYGSYFWDLRTQKLGNPESVLSVASQRPLWWKPMVSERILGATHRQVIVPLFHPPAEEEVNGITPVARADGVEVFFKPRAGEIVTALEVGPEPVSHQVQLQTTRRDGGVAVKLPNFWGWTNVVFDCREE